MAKEFVGPDRKIQLSTGRAAVYRISLDRDELVRMAAKALTSKTQKSKDGPVTIEIIEVLS